MNSKIDWVDLFVYVKLLVYRKDENLNIDVCKYYLKVMSALSLQEYEQLGRKSIDKVWEYLEKRQHGSSMRNSISLTNMDKI
tara:strand:+ start:448 stop:693 length:246 start_codon:yes stop_codon:yes gene_type:complete